MSFEKNTGSRLSREELLRRRAFEERRRAEKEKKKRIVICALSTLLLASVLLFTVAIFELTVGSKYVYVFDSEEKRFNKSDVLDGDVQYVDMNSLAELGGFEKSEFFSSMIYRINGTELFLENGLDTARVNSFSYKLSAPVKIIDGYCFAPLDDIVSLIPAIETSSKDGKTRITLNTDKENIYIMVTDNFKVEYKTDVSAYLEYINSKSEDVLILANKTVMLGKDFEPKELIEIPKEIRKSSVIYLSLPAERALEAMMQDIRAEGFDDVYVTSAYRSYEYQKGLFDNYVNDEMAGGLSYEQAVLAVLGYSAAPGTSEHQTGLCIDFTTSSIGGVVENVFETTPVFAWLKENAWKYGFILRYPADKVDITGYQYEPWHYRFVGLEHAAKIHQCGLSFEEYTELFLK